MTTQNSLIYWAFGLMWLAVQVLANSHPVNGQDANALDDGGPEAVLPETALPETATYSYDPAVAAIEDSNPQTPRDLLWASVTLLDLGRPDLANDYMKRLVGMAPAAEAMVALHRQFGSATFIRLTIDSRLDQGVRQLAADILTAVAEHVTNSQRLDRLTQEVLSDDLETRVAASSEILRGGGASVAPLLRALKSARGAEQRQRLLGMLQRLGAAAEAPLIAALDASDQTIRSSAMQALGRLESHRAVDYLLGPALTGNDPSQVGASEAIYAITRNRLGSAEAGRRLHARVLDLLHGEAHLPADYLGQTEQWLWNDKRMDFDRRVQRQDIAEALVAARLSRDCHHIVPNSSEYRQVYLLSHLQANKLAHGLSQPLPREDGTLFALVSQEAPPSLSDLLARAIRDDLTPAAIGICEVLASTGDPALLAAGDARRSPLAQALIHGDRRLRIAAAHAVLSMHPTQLFPGACDVTKLLNVVLRSTGQRRILIIHPNEPQASELAGLCREMGFEAEIAKTGRTGLKRAFAHADYEFVLISDAVFSPRWTELTQLFRRDPRTAILPIGLLVRNEPRARAQRIERENGLTVAFPFPREPAGLTSLLSQLGQLRGPEPITTNERVAHVRWALDWLDRVTATSALPGYLEVPELIPALIETMQQPRFAVTAAKVLGRLGTPTPQAALVEMVDNSAAPLASRQAAAQAFSLAIERQGVQLTTGQILEQYRLYNGTLAAEIEVMRMLGSVLDRIEHSVEPHEESSSTPFRG